MTVLEDLYYGNLSPFNDYYENPKTDMAVNRNNKVLDKLRENLDNKEPLRLLEELINSQSKVIALTEKDAFLAGFKLGVKVMAEVFED